MKVLDLYNYGKLIGSGGVERFGRYYGLYRGVVTRVENGVYYVKVEDVLGEVELPFGASFKGDVVLQFSSINGSGIVNEPIVGDLVWVAFEQGLIEKPIIVGFWSKDNKEFDFGVQVREGHRFTYKDNKFVFRTKEGEIRVEIDVVGKEVNVEVRDGRVKVIGKEVWVGGDRNSGVLGEELVDVLKQLLEWLKMHSHPMSSPPAQAPQLQKIEQSLNKILSKVVKLV